MFDDDMFFELLEIEVDLQKMIRETNKVLGTSDTPPTLRFVGQDNKHFYFQESNKPELSRMPRSET